MATTSTWQVRIYVHQIRSTQIAAKYGALNWLTAHRDFWVQHVRFLNIGIAKFNSNLHVGNAVLGRAGKSGLGKGIPICLAYGEGRAQYFLNWKVDIFTLSFKGNLGNDISYSFCLNRINRIWIGNFRHETWMIVQMASHFTRSMGRFRM